MIKQTNPDVVLLDIRLPRMDGLTGLELIRKRYPEIKVVMLSVFGDSMRIEQALSSGACGYVVESVKSEELPAAIRQPPSKGRWVYPFGLLEVDSSGGAKADSADLTERKITILRRVARGLSNYQIAEELWVTEQTVKFHPTNVYRKLEIANRTETARYAYRHELENSLSDFS